MGLLVTVAFFTQCKHEPVLKKITIPNPGGNPEDTSICFERDILPIFKGNCATSGCHDAVTHAEDRVFNSYANITKEGIKAGQPNESDLYKELSTGKMSQAKYGNLNQAQKDLIKRWILEGAKDGTNCPSKCDTTKFTFSAVIQPLMNNHCVGCHKPGNLNGSTDLSTHTGVAASANSGKLISSLKRTTNWMPQGGNKLSDCQIKTIQKWIDDGAKNN
jgi:Cytochrome C oxidase, cbb3-type, subunit III